MARDAVSKEVLKSAPETEHTGRSWVKPNEGISLMIVTGEASGDLHAAELLRVLQQSCPSIHAFGMGGACLREAGMEIIVDSNTHASVMGLTEVFSSLGGILQSFRRLKAVGRERRPDILLLLDFPDFNMRLARALREYRGHCVYFITPQVWAWRQYRVKALRRDCSKLIPLFPFEETFYQRHQAEAKWLGHPFVDEKWTAPDRATFLRRHALDPQRPVLAMLPGSRKAEVERLAPSMREAWQRLRSGRPGIQAIVPVASSLDMQWVASHFPDPEIVLVRGDTREVLSSADAAIIASGTATLEAVFCNTPFIIAYKMSSLTYRVGRCIIKGTSFIGIPNVIAQREVVPEFLQEHCTPGALAAALERIFSDAEYVAQLQRGLAEVKDALSYDGPGKEYSTLQRVANEILSLCTQDAQGVQQQQAQ